MIKYTFKDDDNIILKAAGAADPQVIGETLAKIAGKSGGRPSAEAVVEAAKAKAHPLHRHFEWDDSKAAQAHRLAQARNLIRIIRVVDEKTGDVEPAYLSVNDGDKRRYFPVDQVKRNADLQLSVMKQAARELRAWKERYRILKDICAEVAELADKIDKQITAAEMRAAA